MNLHLIDVVTLVAYFVVVATVGIYASRKSTNTENYFLGGRSFKGLIVGISMVGASISCVTFLAFPADSFKTAWLRFVPNLTLPFVVLIASYFFLPFYRRGNITSGYQYLEGRFGPSVRTYGSIGFILMQIWRMTMILYLLSALIKETTGLQPIVSILVAGGCVAVYTILGGLHSVIWTQVVQTSVLVLGGAICIITIVKALPGGFGQVISIGVADGKLALADLVDGKMTPAPWGFSLTSKSVAMMVLVGLNMFGYEYAGNQNVIQRYIASSSAREARKAMWLCSASSVIIWAAFMFLGTALYAFFKVFPCTEATQMLTGAQKAERILPFFIVHHLPPGIVGLVLAAALAAAMSTLNTSINSATMIGVVDIYRRMIKPDASDQHYMRAAYVVSTIASILMVVGAMILTATDIKTLQHTGTVMTSLMSGGFLAIYLLGFLTDRGDARAVWIGLFCTFAFTLWTVIPRPWLPQALRFPFDLYYTGLVGNLMMFVVGYLAGSLLPRRPRNLTNLTIWQQDKTPID